MFKFKQGQKGVCKLTEQGLKRHERSISYDLSEEIFDYEVVFLGRMDIRSRTYRITFRVNPLHFDDDWEEIEC